MDIEEMLQKDLIREIKEHPGYYISKDGKVYSSRNNRWGTNGTLRELKQVKMNIGYFKVALGRKNQKLVHRLVFETFKGDLKEGLVIRHLNDIKTDNRLENLEQGTQLENIQDCIRNGNHKTNRKYPKEMALVFLEAKKTMTWKQVGELFDIDERTARRYASKYKSEVM